MSLSDLPKEIMQMYNQYPALKSSNTIISNGNAQSQSHSAIYAIFALLAALLLIWKYRTNSEK